MGTSSSHTSPTSGAWPSAKRTASLFAREGGNGTVSDANVLSAYVDALGGSKGALESSEAGRKVANRLAGFVGDIAAKGFAQALRERGLQDFIGKSPREVLAGILDYLAGPGGTLPEATGRNVLLEVLSDLWKKFADFIEMEEYWNQNANDMLITDLLEQFVSTHINSMIQNDLGDQIDKGAIEPKKVRQVEMRLKRYSGKLVKLTVRKHNLTKVGWNSPQAGRIIKAVYQAAFEEMKRSL